MECLCGLPVTIVDHVSKQREHWTCARKNKMSEHYDPAYACEYSVWEPYGPGPASEPASEPKPKPKPKPASKPAGEYDAIERRTRRAVLRFRVAMEYIPEHVRVLDSSVETVWNEVVGYFTKYHGLRAPRHDEDRLEYVKLVDQISDKRTSRFNFNPFKGANCYTYPAHAAPKQDIQLKQNAELQFQPDEPPKYHVEQNQYVVEPENDFEDDE